MSMIWEKLIDCKDEIIKVFDSKATEIEEPGLSAFNQPDNGWINRVWANDNIRRAHIDVVDADVVEADATGGFKYTVIASTVDHKELQASFADG